MLAQGGFDTFIEATRFMFKGPTTFEIVLLVVVFSSIILVVGVALFLSKRQKEKAIYESFYTRGKSLELTDAEIQILWKYSKEFPYNPEMIYENKVLFDKLVSILVKREPSKVNLIPSIRSKLKFDTIPWFIPLNTSRDIDLYQTGTLEVGGFKVEAAVWDKTETEIHIALLKNIHLPVRKGDRVKFFFIRDMDGRYSFESRVVDIYNEQGKTVLVLEHTDKLNRVQFRERLSWKVSIPVKYMIVEGNPEEEGLAGISTNEGIKEGTIEDISAKGVRICTENYIKPAGNEYVLMSFQIENRPFENILGRIVNIRTVGKKICIGVKFLNLSKSEEKFIDQFIMNEQRKLVKTYKMGEIT
jgi:c-di-GMP-binding flagellar brake protein YcgR